MNFINKIFRSTTVDFKRKTFYLDFLFLFVCVWTLISSGSEVQYYLFKFIGSDSSTLYGSVFEDAIARIPTFSQYIKGAYTVSGNFGFIAALLIVAASLFYQTSIQVFIVCVISSVFGLTVTDIIMYVVNDSLTTQSVTESIIANTLGSPIIASFVVFLFYIKKILFEAGSVNLGLRFVMSYIVYVLLCSLILLITYYVVCFFYRPTAVNFSVSTSEDFSGNYFITKKDKTTTKNDPEKQKRFSLLGSPVKINESVRVYGDIKSIRSKNNENETFNLNILPLLNCVDGNSVNAASSRTLTYSNVKNLSIKSSEFISILLINDKTGHVKSTDELVNMFSVDKNDKNGFDVTKINDGTFSYYPSESNAGFYLATPVSEFTGNQTKKVVQYTLNIDGDEKIISIEVERLRSINKDKKIHCEVASFSSSEGNIKIKADESVYLGLLVKMEPEEKKEFYSLFNEGNSKIIVDGKLLYIQAQKVSKKDLLGKYFVKGYLDGFVLHSFDKLSLDGRNVESNKMDNLMVMGDDIYANVSDGTNLVISGRADLFYKNRLRQNKTLWETSSDNTLILGGVGGLLVSLLLWVCNKIAATLRRNEVINIF
ncbi:hypothetical protein [Citrobacter freundii]|uniref:hypothetical protein n=1 Tax=Citrobacter freundii TaxID=546 RepID=UPI001900127A|nr:hypothetical protein [Citrobacter freundii]MBJ9315800.1 hypothetical protein [Citrobacter freundii]HEI8945153.1 hypothetical protein [Citrobacter freundii]HEJ0171809.1 hypothetical protein [Citrobacter freundii]